jgi:hypothetical protein
MAQPRNIQPHRTDDRAPQGNDQKKNLVNKNGPVSLYPLTFETAVRAALSVPIRKRGKKQKQENTD